MQLTRWWRAVVPACLALAVTPTAFALEASPLHVTRCRSVTIPVSVTGTIPLTYRDMTTVGVSCEYVTKVFLPDLSKAAAAPPPGWSIRVISSHGWIEDTCTHGREAITFRLTRL